jgi:AcrR family transcriptional regulator
MRTVAMPRGRPARITREQIVQAARAAGDEVRMTDVARALDVAPAALYHHVRDREQLLHLVAAQVLEETSFDEWAPRAGARWDTWLRRYANAFRSAMLANAGMLRYVRLTTAATGSRLAQLDRLVEALHACGFRHRDIAAAVAQVNLLVLGEAWERLLGDDPQLAEFDAAVRARPELANLAPLASASGRPDPDAHFRFALDCLVAGMTEILARRGAGRGGRSLPRA